jgi:hypothetical protein
VLRLQERVTDADGALRRGPSRITNLGMALPDLGSEGREPVGDGRRLGGAGDKCWQGLSLLSGHGPGWQDGNSGGHQPPSVPAGCVLVAGCALPFPLPPLHGTRGTSVLVPSANILSSAATGTTMRPPIGIVGMWPAFAAV